jgi:Rab3 GTPase-activating protein catalytic subunit
MVSCSEGLWLFQSLRKDPLEEEAYKEALSVVAIPPSMIVRRLAAAIE